MFSWLIKWFKPTPEAPLAKWEPVYRFGKTHPHSKPKPPALPLRYTEDVPQTTKGKLPEPPQDVPAPSPLDQPTCVTGSHPMFDVSGVHPYRGAVSGMIIRYVDPKEDNPLDR